MAPTPLLYTVIVSFLYIMPSYSNNLTEDLTYVDKFLSSEPRQNPDTVAVNIIKEHLTIQNDRLKNIDLFSDISEYYFRNDRHVEGLRYFEYLENFVADTGLLKGEVYFHLAKLNKFLNRNKRAEEALEISRNHVGNSAYMAKVYSLFGSLQLNKNNYDIAENYMLRAIELANKLSLSNKNKFQFHLAIISVYSRRIDRASLDYHSKKMENYAALVNDDYTTTRCLLTKSIGKLSTGRWHEGGLVLDKIKSIEKQPNLLRSNFYYFKGLSALVYKEYHDAIDFFKKSLEKQKGVKINTLGLCNRYLSVSYKRLCQMDKSILYRKKAIELYKNKDGYFDAHLTNGFSALGWSYLETGNLQESLDNFLLAYEYSENDEFNIVDSKTNLIIIYAELLKEDYSKENMNNLFSVMADAEKSISQWNLLRHFVDEDVYRESQPRRYYEECLNILFHLKEYTKHPLISQRIVLYTNNIQSLIYKNNKMKFKPIIRDDIYFEFLTQEKGLKIELTKLKKDYENCLSIHETTDLDTELSYLDSIEILKQQHNDLVKSNIPINPVDMEMEFPISLIKEVQSQLSEDEAVISYFDGYSDDFLYSSVITKDNYFSYRKEANNYMREQIEFFLGEIAIPDLSNVDCFEDSKHEFSDFSYELYDYILGDELANISTDVKHLSIITDWTLESFPFNVLLSENSDSTLSYKDMPYLVNDYAVSYEYSLQSFVENREKKRKVREHAYVGITPDYEPLDEDFLDKLVATTNDNAAFNDFVLRGGYINLPGAKQGVLDISSQIDGSLAFTGPRASKQTLVDYVDNSDIIHLATHGVIDRANPELSQIIFTAENENENLHAYELFDVNVDVELLMLSACDTGRGVIQSGKSLQSISQAFRLAGASSITMSFYKIPDEQTAQIDKRFIQNVYDGHRLDESLRLSNLEYLEMSSEKYAHPFYWAGIVVAGKTSPLKKRTKSVFDRLFN